MLHAENGVHHLQGVGKTTSLDCLQGRQHRARQVWQERQAQNADRGRRCQVEALPGARHRVFEIDVLGSLYESDADDGDLGDADENEGKARGAGARLTMAANCCCAGCGAAIVMNRPRFL
jgi:hypothetical protein